MNMKTLRKILAAICATALIVCISVGATIAYLTSDDSVENTFSVGHVTITLDEAKTDEAGLGTTPNPDDTSAAPERTHANDYKLYPGHTYTKDPTIHIDAKSENCWVVAKVVVTATNINDVRGVIGYEGGYLGLADIVSGGVFEKDYSEPVDGVWMSTDGTIKLQQIVGDKENTFYVYYQTEQTAGKDLVLFEELSIPSTWTNDEILAMDGLKMDVSAYAVQAQGFETVEAAFEAGFPEA